MTLDEACDLIVVLTAELAATKADLRDMRAERDSHQLVSRQAVHALAALQKRFDRMQDSYYRLLDAQRQQRAA